ncbi:MAG: MoaD/ThiS family protein [Nitrososphaeria archaeon]|nr:MoaD/ThiS family protein [Nitrososphaeria archaeon]
MKLKLFSPLSEILGFKEKEIRLSGKVRINDIPELSKIKLEEYVISLNKVRVVSADTEVEDKDEIWILPPIDGG